MSDLQSDTAILEVKNAVGVKVSSEGGGEAFVEYSMDITFSAGELHTQLK